MSSPTQSKKKKKKKKPTPPTRKFWSCNPKQTFIFFSPIYLQIILSLNIFMNFKNAVI